MTSAAELLPFIVLFTNDDFNVPKGDLLHAENAEHAEDQFLTAEPDAQVSWIVQTDDINKAFDVYHAESSMES